MGLVNSTHTSLSGSGSGRVRVGVMKVSILQRGLRPPCDPLGRAEHEPSQWAQQPLRS